MSNISITIADITTLNTDAIVNAANSRLAHGSGVCGAIFAAAGASQMEKACDAIGGCPTGSAAITPGFNLLAKYVIHAVGPIYNGGNYGEAELLYSAYMSSLNLLFQNGGHSIAFPLISSGIYGYPMKEAWEVAIKASKDFIKSHSDYEVDITFAVLSDFVKETGDKVIGSI